MEGKKMSLVMSSKLQPEFNLELKVRISVLSNMIPIELNWMEYEYNVCQDNLMSSPEL